MGERGSLHDWGFGKPPWALVALPLGEMAAHEGPTSQGRDSQQVEQSTGACGGAGLGHPVLSSWAMSGSNECCLGGQKTPENGETAWKTYLPIFICPLAESPP